MLSGTAPSYLFYVDFIDVLKRWMLIFHRPCEDLSEFYVSPFPFLPLLTILSFEFSVIYLHHTAIQCKLSDGGPRGVKCFVIFPVGCVKDGE